MDIIQPSLSSRLGWDVSLERIRKIGAATATGWTAALFAASFIALCELLFPETPLGESLQGAGQFFIYGGFLISLLGLVGSTIGAVVSTCVAIVYVSTDLGPVLSALNRWYRRQRDENPHDTRAMLFAHTLAATMALVGWISVASLAAWFAQTNFHHRGLIALLVVAVALVLAVVFLLIELVLARGLGLLLKLFGRVGLLRRTIRWPVALFLATLVVGIALTILVLTSEETVEALELRPAVLCISFVILTAILYFLLVLLREAGKWPLFERSWLRAGSRGAAILALTLGLVALGERPAARVALDASSALGRIVASGIRSLVDLDRDGYSMLIGGGDCDDFDAMIHPAAFDWPDDGTDQNCIGGDATLQEERAASFHPVPDSVPEDLNVLFLTADSVRAKNFGAYGYPRPTSKNLDGLAREGILFRRGYANCSTTRCALPVMVTGRLPFSIAFDGADRASMRRMSKSNRTWPELLGRGFERAVIANNDGRRHFSRDRGIVQGFEHHLVTPYKRGRGTRAEEMVDRAIGLLDGRLKGRRFFMWMHFMDTHEPFLVSPAHKFGRKVIDRYDSEIAYTDQHIGRLLDALGERGLSEKTIVVFTGDHGESHGEHGIRYHDYRLYESLVHVPLIMRVPGLEPRAVEEPVSHVDILPTVLNLLRLPRNDELQGRSAVDLITGGNTSGLQVQLELTSRRGTVYALVERRWKLIYNQSNDTFELYDLENDPEELRNLVLERLDIFDALRPVLVRRMESGALDAETIERLQRNVSRKPFPVATKLDARFGDYFQLLGYEAHPAMVRPGQKLKVTFFFKSLRQLPESHRLLTHLYWRGRKRSTQADHDPVGGVFPIRYWSPGQHIRDEIEVTVPGWARPGPVKIVLGAYQSDDRLPIDSDGEVVNNALHFEAAKVVRRNPR